MRAWPQVQTITQVAAPPTFAEETVGAMSSTSGATPSRATEAGSDRGD